MFFEWEKRNASNANFVSAAIIVANLIFLANTLILTLEYTTLESNSQSPSPLVYWLYRKKTTHAMDYKG